MRRPFAWLGWTVLSALAAASVLGSAVSARLALLCGGLGLCALIFWIYKRHQKGTAPGALFPFCVVLLTAALAFFSYSGAYEAGVRPYEALAGEKAVIWGRVEDYPEQANSKYYYRIRVERVTVDGKSEVRKPFIVRMSTEMPLLCKPWDYVDAPVTFFAFEESGLYSAQRNRLADGIVLGAYLSGYEMLQVAPTAELPPGKFLSELRRLVGRNLQKLLPREEAGLIRAMLLGQRDGLSPDTVSDFREIGTSHLLVISGLHMAVLAGFLSLALGRLPIGRVGRNLLTALALLLFLCLIGFPSSAVRSCVMFFLFLLADCSGKDSDGLNSLGFALLLLCGGNLFSGGDLGLALSALATLGILLFSHKIQEILEGPMRKRPFLRGLLSPLTASLAVSLSVTLSTLPVQLGVFGGLPLLSPLANLVLVPPCTLLLYGSFGAAFLTLHPVLAPLAAPLVFCAGWLARFALWAAGGLAKIQGFYLELTAGVLLILAAVLILFTLLVLRKRERLTAAVTACAMVLLVLFGWGLDAWRWQGVVTVAVVGTEQVPCVLLMKEGRAAVLSLSGYDSGAASAVLAKNNIRKVETLYLPKRDQEARQASERILRKYGAGQVVLPEGSYLGEDLKKAARESSVKTLRPGESFEALPDIRAAVTEDFSRVGLTVNGVDLMVELTASVAGECGVLVTGLTDSRVTAALKIVSSENSGLDFTYGPDCDMINNKMDFLSPGSYMLGEEGGTIYLDIARNGSISIRKDEA